METSKESSTFDTKNCKLELKIEENRNGSISTVVTQDSRSYLASPKSSLWWHRRTPLEKRMVIGGAVVTFTCAGFLVGLIAMSTCGRSNSSNSGISVAAFGYLDNDNNNYIEFKESQLCTTTDCLNAAIFVKEAIDPSVDPCEDFFEYSCGNWIRNHPIPEDKSGYSIFDQARDDLFLELRSEIEKPKKTNDLQAIQDGKDIYEACMNMEVADRHGLERLKDWVNSYGGWPLAAGQTDWNATEYRWEDVIVRMASEFAFYLISIRVYADERNTNETAVYVSNASPSLDPNYFLNPDNFSNIIDEYREYLNDMAIIMSNGTSAINQGEIDNLLEFETMLANISMSGLESEEHADFYNKVTVAQLTNITNHQFDWLGYLTGVFTGITNVTNEDVVIVLDFYPLVQLIDYLDTVDNRTIANYLMWLYVRKYSWHASDRTRDRSFAFSQVLDGIEVQKARWLDCVEFVSDLFPHVMATLYVQNFVSNDTKHQAEEMVGDLRKSFSWILESNTWMDEATLVRAKEKAEALMDFVGYPEWVHNTTVLNELNANFTPSAVHIDNLRNANLKSSNLYFYQIVEPFDRSTWSATPHEVNAFYSPSTNSIIFPAGILQPPFFGSKNLKAMNYGAVGTIIGHEITHAFDTNGRQNDKDGNLVNWWSNSSLIEFHHKANCMRKQYFNYCLEDVKQALNKSSKVCVDGNDTLGENIADNGGMKIALNAYKSWIKINGEEARLPSITNFTPMQLFFISFAQVGCDKSTPIGMYKSVRLDSHSPEKYRILGVLSNLEDFATAFQCKINSTYNPEHKCSFW